METITETLQDIVNKIQIDFYHVSHTDYPSEPPSAEFIQCFEQLSIEIQQRYLQSELQDLLYRVYFSREVTVPIENNALLINNRVQGSDLQFIEQLKQSNAGTGYYNRGWKIVKQETDGMLAVQKSGLMLHIPPHRRLEQTASVSDIISILLPNSRIENHYYVAISNAGDVSGSIVKFFFNLKSEGASVLMSHITQQLECPFTLEVALDPSDYSRCDSCVLSIRQSDYQLVWKTVKIFHQSHCDLFLDAIPFLTKRLGAGLAIANASGLALCALMANALLNYREQSSPEDENRLLHHSAELPSRL